MNKVDENILLQLSNVWRYFGRVTALRGIDLSIRQGQRWVFFGGNGAGKTTLLRTMAGLLRPSRGEVFYEGDILSQSRESFHRRLGFLSHDSMLYDGMTVQENLRFRRALYSLPDEEKAVRSILEEHRLDHLSGEQVRNLSRGYRQRVALACTLVHNPGMVILDEPLSGLDSSAKNFFNEHLSRNSSMTLILASHDQQWAQQLCPNAAVLEQGAVSILRQEAGP